MAKKALPQGVRLRSDGRYEGRTKTYGETYSVYADTPREALEKLEELKYQLRHGIYCKPNEETITSWFEIWMETYKENTVKKSTIQTYRQVFDEFIKPAMGRRKICELTSQAIQAFINGLYKKGYSKSRVRMVYLILSGMLKQALLNGITNRNLMEAVVLPKYQKPRQEDRRVMTLEEQRIFMEAAKKAAEKQKQEKKYVYYDFYVMALTTGMRLNEVLALRWSDIDFNKKEIHVNGTLFYNRGGDGRTIETPKTETSRRTIPMLEETETLLRARRKKQLEDKMKFGKEWKEENNLSNMVMTHEDGGVFWDTDIRVDMKKIIAEIQKEYDFEPITPHTFRHTFATRCAESGMPLQVLKTILGHSSLAMTADLYSHVLPDTKAEEMQKVANLL